ncbi:MAG: DUF2782 domain-containing protein [Betaproteobacteria bacterium]|nr:DUF2782 domain-containing protein [Betaproteobacteria bacterium]
MNHKKGSLKEWAVLLAMLSLPLMTVAVEKSPPADLQPLEEIPPPTISNDDNPDEPQITIVKKKGETIEEYRINGQLYMMKITPDHGVPYYLHKEDQDGGWVNSGPNPPLGIPKWTVFTF